MKNNKGSGCLIYILMLSFLCGNLLLIGGMKDLKDNSIAIVMVLFAVVGDIALLAMGVNALVKHFSKNENQSSFDNKSADDNGYKDTLSSYTSQPGLSNIQLQKKAIETKRIKQRQKDAEKKRAEQERKAAEGRRLLEEYKAAESRRIAAERKEAESRRLALERKAAEASQTKDIKSVSHEVDKRDIKKNSYQQLANTLNEVVNSTLTQTQNALEKVAGSRQSVVVEREEFGENLAEAERKAAEAKRVEAERKAVEAKHMESERRAAEAKRVEAERKAAEAKRVEAERKTAEKKKFEPDIDLSWVKYGAYVRHKQFGFGTIKSVNKDTVTIRFGSSERVFAYPGSFTQLLIRKAEKQQEVTRLPWKSLVPKWVDIGGKVSHDTFGIGTIKSIENNIICIVFDRYSDYKYFIVPTAFEKGYLKQPPKVAEIKQPPKVTEAKQISNAKQVSKNAQTPVVDKSKEDKAKSNTSISWNEIDLDEDLVSSYHSQPISRIKSVEVFTKPNIEKEKEKRKKQEKKESYNLFEIHSKLRRVQVPENPPHPALFYSEYSNQDTWRAREACMFVQQAKIITNCKEERAVDCPAGYCNKLTSFTGISMQEFQAYIHWRTKIESGSGKEDYRFAYLYLQELVNNTRNKEINKKQLQYFIDYAWTYLYEKLPQYYYSLYSIQQLIVDYYVMNDFSVKVHDFNQMLPKAIRIKEVKNRKPASRIYSESLSLLSVKSSYNFLNSSFYKTDYGYLLPQAIDFVFKKVEEYLKNHSINWFDAIFNTTEKDTETWVPFERLYYYPGETIKDRMVELENGDTYVIKNGKGLKKKYLPFGHLDTEQGVCSNPFTFAIGYTIKLIENELRIALGYRHKLRPEKPSESLVFSFYRDKSIQKKYSSALTVFKTDEYEGMVKAATNEFFNSTSIDRMILSVTYQRKKAEQKRKEEKAKALQKAIEEREIARKLLQEEKNKEIKRRKEEKEYKAYRERIAKETGQLLDDVELPPKTMQFDRSKLDDIRKNAEEIQSLLVTEEDVVPNSLVMDLTSTNPAVRSDMDSFYDDSIDSENEYVILVNSLSELEKEILCQIVKNEPVSKINSYSIKNNDSLEAIIDRINQIALDAIADNLIDSTDQPYVYEDYVEEIREALEAKDE